MNGPTVTPPAPPQPRETPRFGGQVAPETDRLLNGAAASCHDGERAEQLLLEARARDPQCLPVYFALYKFYFYRRRLEDAERAAQAALDTAARLSDFAADWRVLTPQSAPWTDVETPAHFYLFSLKALAFIRMRLGRYRECDELLAKLAELDPQDQVGGSVIRALARGCA